MSETYSVEAILSVVDKNFTRAMNQAVKQTENLTQAAGKNIAKAGEAIGDFGKKLTVGVTTPLVAAGGMALKFGMDYEEALTGVAKTTGLSGKALESFSDQILEMTRRIPASAVEIAGVAEAAGQLGIKTENLTDFTETMIKLGSATSMSSDEAAVSLAQLANITGMPQTEFGRLGSAVVKLGNNLATTESEIVEMGLRLASTGHQVGLTEAQILGLSGAMSSVGINAEAGGSAMSRVLQKINTEVLGSGEKLQAFADIAGTSAQEFAKTWKEEPEKALIEFMKGLDNVNKSGGDVAGTLKALGITSVQELNTLLALSGNTDLLTNSLDMANEAWKENTALNEEAQQAFETTKAKIKIMISALQEFGQVIVEKLMPIIGDFVEKITSGIHKATDKLKGLSEEQTLQIAKWGAMVAAIGPVLTILGPAISGIGKAGELASKGVEKASSGISILGGKARELKNHANTAFIKLQDFALIGPTFERLNTQFVNSGVKMLDFKDSILQSESRFVQWGVKGFQATGKVLGGLKLLAGAGLQMAIPAAMVGALVAVIGLAGVAFGDEITKMVNTAIEKGPEIITKLGQGISSAIPTLIETGAQVIHGLGLALAANLPAIFEQGTNIIVNLINGLAASLPKLIPIAFQVIGQFLIGIGTNLPRIMMAGVNFIVQLVQGIVHNLPMLLVMAGQAIGQFVQGVMANLPQLLMMGIQLVFELIKGILTAIPSIISSGFEIIKGFASGLIEGIVNFIPNVIEGIKGIWSGFTSWITGESAQSSKQISSDMQTATFEMNNSATEMNSNLTSQFSSMFENVTGQTNQLAVGVTGDMTSMYENTQGITGSLADEVTGDMARINSDGQLQVGQFTDSTTANFSSLSGSIASSSSNAANSAIGNFKTMSAGSTSEVANMAGMTEEEFQQMTNQVDNQMLRLEGVFKRAFGAIDVQIGESISSISDTYNQGMTNMLMQSNRAVSSITNVFREFASTMQTLGSQAGLGFSIGLGQQRGRIMSTANSIASSVASTIRRALSIHSPSRVLKYLGEMTGEGFAGGIEHMVPAVEKASDKMASSAIPSLESNMSRANRVEQQITHHLSGSQSRSKLETLVVKLNVGGYDFRDFVQTINREQGKMIELGGAL